MQVLIEREDGYHTKWLQSNYSFVPAQGARMVMNFRQQLSIEVRNHNRASMRELSIEGPKVCGVDYRSPMGAEDATHCGRPLEGRRPRGTRRVPNGFE